MAFAFLLPEEAPGVFNKKLYWVYLKLQKFVIVAV